MHEAHFGAAPTPGPSSGTAPLGGIGVRGRILTLTAVLLSLELLIFREHWFGVSIPPWDFLGQYNVDAYYWWTHGDFFSPPEWVPTSWAGYPSAATLQNSAWYLPVGLVSIFTPYTLHAAAALAALHVAWGFIGAYQLVRHLTGRFDCAIFAGTAWFFAVGFYSNASHVDIARAYAWIPWVFLVLSHSWSWNGWWRLPVGALILWQAATAMYPGTVIALVYVAAVWVVASQLVSRARLRDYLLPLGATGGVALLLCAPRLLPYYLLGATSMAVPGEMSQFTPSLVGTVLFGYGSEQLPNDITMRSFFVPATVVVLALAAPLRAELTRLGLAMAVPAALLGVPLLPWFEAVQALPGMSLSRFTMSDFKVFLVLGAVLVASSGLAALVSRTAPRRRETAVRAALLVAVLVVLLVAAVRGPYTVAEVAPQLLLVTVAVAVTAAALGAPWLPGMPAAATVAALTGLTVVSGTIWASDNSAPWKAPREATEAAVFGGKTVDQLFDEAAPDEEHERRPARVPLPATYTAAEIRGQVWSAGYYSGVLAIGGYANLRGFATQTSMESALIDPRAGQTFAAFLSADGGVVPTSRNAPVEVGKVQRCLEGAGCGPARVVPRSWAPGSSQYEVSATSRATALIAESYYRGWEAKVCPTRHEACQAVEVRSGPAGLVTVSLPEGKYRLNLDYVTPGLSTGWWAFGVGACAMIGWVVVRMALRTRAQRRKEADER